MKFDDNAFDIPQELLDAHKKGEVVFFCGAGLSANNRYPLFENLYETICGRFDYTQDIGNSSLESKFNLLADSVQGGINQVKKEIASVFSEVAKHDNLETQKALLKLSCRNNSVHLITTNYDSLFSLASKKLKSQLPITAEDYYPPFLPLSYGCEWNGVVYLHGNFEHSAKISNYDSIILTSSDFGRAYLTQGWATNFMKYVFSKFKVCFIGYSLKDQIFNYLMDSISLDDDNKFTKAWIITNSVGSEITKKQWKLRKIEPIYYLPSDDNHSNLHDTLVKWSKVYQHSSKFKNEVIQKINKLTYDGSDAFVDSLKSIFWCLLDPTKDVLNALKALNHQKGLEFFLFLQKLCKEIKILSFCNANQDNKLRNFQNASLFLIIIEKLSDYLKGRIVNELNFENWFSDSQNIALENQVFYRKWTYLYLADEELLFLFQNSTFHLSNDEKSNLIEALSIAKQNKSGRAYSKKHNRLPSAKLTKLWHLYVDDLLGFTRSDLSIYGFFGQKFFQSVEDVSFLLNENCRPILQVSKSANCYRTQIHHAKAELSALSITPLDIYLPVAQGLIYSLAKLLQISEELSQSVISRVIEIPSISEDKQNDNNTFSEYADLIYFVRDCWLDLNSKDQNAAKAYLEIWIREDDIYFKRLALFGATVCKEIEPHTILQWLLSDSYEKVVKGKIVKLNALENVLLTREVCQLLKLRGNEFTANELEKLVSSIFSIKVKKQNKSQRMALLLSRLSKSGAKLDRTKYKKRIARLLKKYNHLLNDNDSFDYPVRFISGFKERSSQSIITHNFKSAKDLRNYLMENRNNREALEECFSNASSEELQYLQKLYKKIIQEKFDLIVSVLLINNFCYLRREISESLCESHIDLIKLSLSKNITNLDYSLPKFIDKSICNGYFESYSDLFISLIYKYIDYCIRNKSTIDLTQSNLIDVIYTEILKSNLGNLVVHLAINFLDDNNENLSIESRFNFLKIIKDIFISSDDCLLDGRLACVLYYDCFQNLDIFKQKFYSLIDLNNENVSENEHKATWFIYLRLQMNNKVDLSIPNFCDNFLRLYEDFLHSSLGFSLYSSVLAQIILESSNTYKVKIKEIIYGISLSKKCVILDNIATILALANESKNNTSSDEINRFNRAVNNLSIFFKECWIKTRLDDASLATLSPHISKIIVETDSLFPKFYNLLNMWLTTLTPWDFAGILYKLDEKEYVTKVPDSVIDFMSKIKSNKIPHFQKFSSLIMKLDNSIKHRNEKLEEFKAKL